MITPTQRAVNLTKYLVGIPSSLKSFMLIITLSFTFGVCLGLLESRGELALINSVVYGGAKGIFLVGLPAVLSAFVCSLMKRELKIKRMLFLSFICAIFYTIFYLSALIMKDFNLIVTESFNLVFVGYGLVFALCYLTANIVFGLRWYGALLFATTLITFNIAFFLASKVIVVGDEPLEILIKFYFASFVFLAGVYAIFWLINAPMKRNFGVSCVDAVRLFLAQWFEHSKELEDILQTVGEEIDTLVGVVGFKKRGEKRLKCVFVTPYVHFGPFGNLGGSEFPYLLSKKIGGETDGKVFVFHGTATHDFNPSSSDEVEKIFAVCSNILASLKFEEARGSFQIGKHKTCKAHCLVINDNGFIGLTRAPRTTEDIDFSLGLAFRNYALAMGLKEAIIVDAHNSETGEITRVESGDPISFEYIEAIKDGLSKRKEKKGIKLGVGENDMGEFSSAGIGKNGLKLAVFHIDGFKYALILLDANGILPGYRRDIIDYIKAKGVNECEVFTTDTHSVNVIGGVLHPVGKEKKREILEQIELTFEKAIQDLEEVEVGVGMEMVKGIRVFGVKHSSELIGTVNSIIAVMRIIVPLILIASVLIILWGITKI